MTIILCCPAAAAGECGSIEGDLVLVEQERLSAGLHSSDLVYKVCINVLSDVGILTGDVLRLTRLSKNELPSEISVCAVEFDLDNSTLMLLRLFVPPRQLIANSICNLPQLTLGPTVRIVAAAPWNEFFPRGHAAALASAGSAA